MNNFVSFMPKKQRHSLITSGLTWTFIFFVCCVIPIFGLVGIVAAPSAVGHEIFRYS